MSNSISINAEPSGVGKIIEAARASVEAEERVGSIEYLGVDVPVVVRADGGVHVAEDVAKFVEQRDAAPQRRSGNVRIDDLDSLIAIVNRQKLDGQTAAFVRKDGPVVIVVLDWHRPNAQAAGWRGDMITFAPKLSRQWVAWNGLAKGPIGQDAFADFLEDNIEDVAERDPYPLKLALVQMARDLHVSIGQKFQRTVDPASGDVTLACVTDSGQSKTKIPREFLLGIPVFDGSSVNYAIKVGLKLELKGSDAFFHVKPRNADAALEDAVADVRKAIAEKCEIPVFAGTP